MSNKKHKYEEGSFLGRIANSIKNATLQAAMADSPAVMTAAGYEMNPSTGEVTQDVNWTNAEKRPDLAQLQSGLSSLGTTALATGAAPLVTMGMDALAASKAAKKTSGSNYLDKGLGSKTTANVNGKKTILQRIEDALQSKNFLNRAVNYVAEKEHPFYVETPFVNINDQTISKLSPSAVRRILDNPSISPEHKSLIESANRQAQSNFRKRMKNYLGDFSSDALKDFMADFSEKHKDGGFLPSLQDNEKSIIDYQKVTGNIPPVRYDNGGLSTIGIKSLRYLFPLLKEKAVPYIRERLYNNVQPSYYHVDDALDSFLFGNEARKSVEANEENYNYNGKYEDKISEALWAKYLGKEDFHQSYPNNVVQKVSDVFAPAEYSPDPSEHQDEGNNFYVQQYRDPTYDDSPLSDRSIYELVKSGNKTIQRRNMPLGAYNVYLGEDNQGKYIAYYDGYNINPFHGDTPSALSVFVPESLRNKEDIMGGIGKPFNLYDRRYFTDDELEDITLNEAHDENENKKYIFPKEDWDEEGVYEGMYMLPEFTVTKKTKADGGPIKAYKDLSIKERAAIIKTGVKNGLRSLEEIEKKFNEYIK